MHIVHTDSSCGWGGQEIRVLEEAAGMLAREARAWVLSRYSRERMLDRMQAVFREATA